MHYELILRFLKMIEPQHEYGYLKVLIHGFIV